MSRGQPSEQGEKYDPSEGAARTKVAEVRPGTRAQGGSGCREGDKGTEGAAGTRSQKAGSLGCPLRRVAGATKYVQGGEEVGGRV